MSLDLAFQVADNRLSLREALAMHTAAASPRIGATEPQPRASGRKVWLSFIGVTLLVAVASLMWIGFASSPDGDDSRGSAAGARAAAWKHVELQTDELDRIVSISGPDPTAVLRGFCQPKPSQQRCEPVEIRAAVSGAPGLRWGIFRATGERLGLRAIEIRRGGTVRSWTAGDGSGPIDDVAAPDSPPGTPTIPVSWSN